MALARSAGSAYTVTMIVPEYALILSNQGHHARARQIVREALERQQHGDSAWTVGYLLAAFVVANNEVRSGVIARQLGAVDALLREGAGPPSHVLGHAIDHVTIQTKTCLSPERFAKAWEAGRTNPEAVVANILTGKDAN